MSKPRGYVVRRQSDGLYMRSWYDFTRKGKIFHGISYLKNALHQHLNTRVPEDPNNLEIIPIKEGQPIPMTAFFDKDLKIQVDLDHI